MVEPVEIRRLILLRHGVTGWNADGRWVLIDYGEIVVHVQHEEERQFYALERLWRDCPTIDLPADVTAGPAGA